MAARATMQKRWWPTPLPARASPLCRHRVGIDEGPPLAVSYALTDRGMALLPAAADHALGAGAPRRGPDLTPPVPPGTRRDPRRTAAPRRSRRDQQANIVRIAGRAPWTALAVSLPDPPGGDLRDRAPTPGRQLVRPHPRSPGRTHPPRKHSRPLCPLAEPRFRPGPARRGAGRTPRRGGGVRGGRACRWRRRRVGGGVS